MSHKVYFGEKSFVVEVDPATDPGPVNDLMGAVQDAWVREIIDISRSLGVSDQVAQDIWYLRTRSRWTQELEDQLVAAARAGKPIDSVKVCSGEWPEDHVSPLNNLK